MTRGRRAVVAVIGVLAVVAAIAALRGCDDERRPAMHDAAPSHPATVDDGTHRPRRARVNAEPATPASAATPPAFAPDTLDGFPAIGVQVAYADGTPAVNAVVYAMRAGSPGRRRAEFGIHGTTDRQGRCVLPFPGEGLFDIGVRLDELAALRTDVVVPRDEPVVLALPEPASLVFEIDATDAPDSARPNDIIHVVTENIGTDLEEEFPGRGDTLRWRGNVRPKPDEGRIELAAPRGVPLVAIPDGRLTVTPRELTPPATTAVSWWRPYELALTVVFVPPSDREIDDGWIELTFEERHSNLAGRRGVTTRWSDLVPADDGTRSVTLDLEFHLRGGELVWSGPGIMIGGASVGGLVLDADNARTIRVELTGAPLLEEHPRARPAPKTSVSVRPTGNDARPVKVFVAHTNGGGMGSQVLPGTIFTTGVLDPGWVVAFRGLDVAGPVARTGGADHVHELTLARGGFVELDMERAPPTALGRFSLEPKDGGVVLVEGALLARADIWDGLRLGPLPAGGHTFRLRLGEEEVGELTVAVSPGSEQVIAVPRPESTR